ncbi:MAG TPA: hypothetical protein VJ837_03630, partial [Candidatus Paceibacterota bacterium]|nr:hypothetical protein [Candidatus Paceibacterota bacterium]
MLDKIKNLQWHFQLLLLVVIATLLYLSVWYFFTSVTREQVRVKNEEVAALQAKNEAARVA